MDVRYETALRNATQAWSQNRMTDHLTLQDLKTRSTLQPASTGATTAVIQPEEAPRLARSGHLGTQLNLFA